MIHNIIKANFIPYGVSLISPIDGAINQPDYNTFYFNYVGREAIKYHIQFSLYINFRAVYDEDMGVNIAIGGGNSRAFSLGQNTYYWRVRAYTPVIGDWSNIWSFETQS